MTLAIRVLIPDTFRTTANSTGAMGDPPHARDWAGGGTADAGAIRVASSRAAGRASVPGRAAGHDVQTIGKRAGATRSTAVTHGGWMMRIAPWVGGVLAVALAGAGVSVVAAARQARTAPPPFPADARVAVMNLQGVIEGSQLGRALGQKVKALQDEKVKALEQIQKTLQDNQAKLGSGLMNPDARAALQRQIERQQVEFQRAQQDAQTEVQNLQADLEAQFDQAVGPVVRKVAEEKRLHLLLGVGPGIMWFDPALDLTPEVIARLDASGGAGKQ